MISTALQLTLLASSGALKLMLAPVLPCHLETRMAPALVEQGLADSTGELTVSLKGALLDIEMRTTEGNLLGQRELAVTKEDCAVLPRTLALLVRLWTQAALPAPEMKKATVAPSPNPEVSTTAVPPRPAKERAPKRSVPRDTQQLAKVTAEPRPVSSASTEKMSADAGASMLSAAQEARAALTADAGAPPHAEATVPTPAAEASTPTPIAVTLSAGGGFAAREPVVAQGALAGEWEFLETWGAGLEVGVETPRTATAGEGRVNAWQGWATLSARRRIISHLHVMAGFRLWLLQATAQGFSESRSATVLTPGFIAQLEWRQPIYSGLYLVARPGVSARVRPEALSIEGVGRVLQVSPWSFFVHGGIGWRFD